MIERLSIHNFAIIDKLEMEFEKGFHAFTGETGAGKSIIVGALSFLLGDRGDSTVVRTGADKAIVEAEFVIHHPYTLERLRDLNIDEPKNLIIRREISSSGKSRGFVNGLQETITRLNEIGQWLLDVHGQHDHQLLLNQKVHIDILDSYAGLFESRKPVREIYDDLHNKIKYQEELESSENQLEQEKIFWETAISDIEEAGLIEGEEEELKQQLERMEHAEKIKHALSDAYQRLYDDELAVSSRLTHSIQDIGAITEIDPKYQELIEILEDAATKIGESINLLTDYKDEMDIDESSIDQVTDRIQLIKDLKRKYKKQTNKELLHYAEECRHRLDSFSNRAEELERIKDEIIELKTQMIDASMKLSKKRQAVALALKDMIEEELTYLGMDKCEFIVDLKYVRDENSIIIIQDKPIKITPIGIDRIEFLISTNPGQEAKPLRKIASGGEISRIMLALKSILSNNDSIDTLIFDEIDVGIGGVTANNVAEKLRHLSQDRQLMVITHLAQIAAKSNIHFTVAKEVSNGSTYTVVNRLNDEQRVEEIARMLGGESELSIAHAREMLG